MPLLKNPPLHPLKNYHVVMGPSQMPQQDFVLMVLPPQSNFSEFTSTSPPLGSPELAADNVTTINNNTAGQLLSENELDSGEIIASAPAPEEIQMDTNGDGIVDETESQNQPVLTGNNLTTEEIQMDTNGDVIVDENESQNQPVLTGNNLPLGPKTGAQTFGGGTPQAKGCEGDLAIELPLARKTLEIADKNAGDFLRLLQAGAASNSSPLPICIGLRNYILVPLI